MFKSEAKLFLSANNNMNYAKNLINECKRIISEIELPDNKNYDNCKKSINGCDVNGLSNKIEETKQNLFLIDQEFAGEYMTLLEENMKNLSIDTSKMTDEEKMQYTIQMNAYARDYNYSLLYMLEKYEGTGMLTPELEAQLQYQKTIVEQYGIQDQMAALETTSQKYIDLFKKNAEYDKKLINLHPQLTDEEKANYLKEYEKSFNSTLDILELKRDVAKKTDELKDLEANSEEYYKKEREIIQLQINYYENKGELTETEKSKLAELKDYKELNGLYIDQAQNSNFFHSFIYDEYEQAIYNKKKEMKITTPDEDEWHNMSGWERAWENTKTFTTSVVMGIGTVTEGIIDGTVMLLGGVGSIFGADTKWAEDFVSISYTDEAYQGLIESDFLNSVSANSGWHDTGAFIGEVGATIMLQFLPGGTYVMVAAHGLKGMGEASETALQKGHSFGESFGYGAVRGSIDAAASYLLYGKGSGGKVADNVGKKLGGEKLMNLAQKGFTKIGASGYANAVFKPSLITKFLVAGGKEWAKEGTNLIIGEEFNWKEAGIESLKSMVTTAFNEFVVSPAVNAATKNYKGHKDNVSKADEQYNSAKSQSKDIQKQMKEIQKSESQKASDDIDEMLGTKSVSATHGSDELRYLEAAYATQKNIMDNAYNDLSLWDEVVGRDFINKFWKKVGSKFMDEVVFE